MHEREGDSRRGKVMRMMLQRMKATIHYSTYMDRGKKIKRMLGVTNATSNDEDEDE